MVAGAPRPKADLNVQVQAPAQLAVGQTAELKTTLNNVSGATADGVTTVPNFRLSGFSTRNVDVLGVSATAGTCKIDPVKDFDDTTGQQIVIPSMVNISCTGGTLAPGGAITATVTVKATTPGVVRETPSFFVPGMDDTTIPQNWWDYPEFRVGIFQTPAPPAAVRRPDAARPAQRSSPPRPAEGLQEGRGEAAGRLPRRRRLPQGDAVVAIRFCSTLRIANARGEDADHEPAPRRKPARGNRSAEHQRRHAGAEPDHHAP